MASQLIGKRVLIGLTYVESGQDDRYEQKHGVVEDVSDEGVAIRLSGGEITGFLRTFGPGRLLPRGSIGFGRRVT